MRAIWLAAIVVIGCYTPRPVPGAACTVDGLCPTGLVCIAGTCVPPGLVDTDASVQGDAPGDAAATDATVAPSTDAPPDAFVDPTLIAHWTFDDDPSDGARDSSGRGHDATCVAACPTLAPGVIGNGYRFDAEQDHALTVPDHPDFRGVFTLAAWFQADAAPGNLSIMAKPYGTDTANSWQLELRDTKYFSFSGGTAHYLDSPTQIGTGTWHHVAGTWDGTTKRLYLDGVLVASVASSITYDTHALYLGGDENYGTPVLHWHGVLDDLRIYSRVLSASEIAALAQ